MKFKKYQHLERFGTEEVDGIEVGKCYVFPKVDGTNASVWLKDGEVKAGSRNRELTLENDNAGFYAYVIENESIKQYLTKNPTHRLYGEWLVPHTIKTYNETAWRKFYIFDVCVDDGDSVEYLEYETYQTLLNEFNLDYISPIAIILNGVYESFCNCLEKNIFLIQDGKGIGEGVVIKKYGFKNKYGRTTWAKIVTNEFKEKHTKTIGTAIYDLEPIEKQIADKFITKSLTEKELAKLKINGDWSSKKIPEFLNRVYYNFVTEEIWEILKVFKNPTINFKTLNRFSIQRIKELEQNLF